MTIFFFQFFTKKGVILPINDTLHYWNYGGLVDELSASCDVDILNLGLFIFVYVCGFFCVLCCNFFFFCFWYFFAIVETLQWQNLHKDCEIRGDGQKYDYHLFIFVCGKNKLSLFFYVELF